MKKSKSVFFLIIILLVNTPIVYSASNEGYGEDQEALGQFVDSFENLGNVSVVENVVRNSSLNAMELNFSGVGPVFEDFTTYTEVDEDGDVTITVPEIDWDTMRRDAETYVWKDFGAGFFGDFEHIFQINITDVEAGDASSATITVFSLVSNNTGVMDDLQASNWLGVALAQNGAVDDTFRFLLWERDAGGTVDLDSAAGTWDINDPIYIIFNRTGNDVDCLIFSDNTFTTLTEKLEITGNGKTYRYLEPLANSGRNVDPADHQTGYITGFSMGEAGGFQSTGYFTTTDYLSDPLANGSILVQMTNTSIPDNTIITVEFSDDNATWVLNDWQPIFGGFESIDLRDLNYSAGYYIRYNLSTTDIAITPRIYQSRLITTIGNSTGNGGPVVSGGINSSSILLVIFLLIIGITLIYGVYRRK